MRTRTRILVAIAALALLVPFVVPLWRISLEAPQYPEGLGLLIRIDGIEGVGEHDLANINGLNHYIGMRPIVPESIPELRFMPFLLGGLVVFGLVAAVTGRRRILQVWLGAFLLLGIAGLADFYRWGYEYGHDLAPDAIIKVPGMSYQPPLIGTKQLLNFTATSWPDIGGWVAIGALLLGIVALLLDRRHARAPQEAPARAPGSGALAPVVLLLALVGAACARGPRPIEYGVDECAQCRMQVADARYGAELVTRTGRVLVFDAIECLARFRLADSTAARAKSLWVTDHERPGTLIDATGAVYLRSDSLRSPMGMNLTAFAGNADTGALRRRFGGAVLRWPQVLALVQTQSAQPGAGRHLDGTPGR